MTADGVSTTTLTVTVDDANGNPVAGQAVTLTSTGSGDVFGANSGSTNASGVFSTTLASTSADVDTIKATEGSAQETTNVTFVARAPSGDNYVWIGPVEGSWDVAGNWEDTTAGQDPASVAPGSNDSVTINAAGSTTQVITGTGDSASLTIDGATSLAGDFTTGALAVNSALTVSTGDTLAVSGNATFDGLFTLDGTLTAGSLTTDNGSFNITGGTLTAGSLTTEIGGFDLNAGATLSITGNVAGSGNQFVSDSTFTVGGTFTSANDYVQASSGSTVQLANLAVATGFVDLYADNTTSVEIGTAGGAAAGSITIDSGVTTTVGAGYFEASSIVDNGTLIVAAGGQFALYGSLGGNGQIEIGSGAELTVYGTAAASAPTITFEGTGDTLTLSSNAFNASQDFTPTLSGLNANDVIDYQGTVTSAVYASTGTNIGTLTLYDNTTAVGTLTLAGNYTGDTFYAVGISSGTTQIGELGTGDTSTAPSGTSSADNYVWVGPVAGSWDVAGNWEDTTAGLDPATVAPGSNDDVTINAAGSAVQVVTGTGDSASLTINGATSLAGDFTTGALAVNSALTVSTGDTLAVSGNATFDGLFTLDGTLTAGSLTTDNGSFNITGGTLTAGSLTTEIGGFDLNAGATLSITGNVAGSGNQFVSDSTFTVGGTFTSANDYVQASSGSTVQLANLAVATGFVDLYADNTTSVEIGTAGGAAAGSITIDSGVTTTVGAGYFEASSIVDNGTLIVAAGGQFALYGSLGGNGQIEIGSGAELTVYGTAAASAPTITFEGTGDTLTLSSNAFNASQDFTPTLSGLNANDVIDYQGTVTSAVYASTGTNIGTLTLYDNTTTVGTLTLAGNYTGDTFYAVGISSGTTQIGELGTGDTSTAPSGTSSADNYVWVGPVAGSWDVAGNWEDTTAGLDPATVAPGSNDDVTINAAGSAVQVVTGTGDSASLTINGATSLAGDFTTGALAVNSALTVSTGDTLAVSGNATFDGLFTLDGTLTAGSLTTDNGSFNITGGTLTAGSLTTEIGGFDLNAGATLSITGNVAGSGNQFVSDSTFTVGGTFTSANDYVQASSGSTVQLANLAVATGFVDLYADNTTSVEIGTAGGAAAGSITIDSGVTTTVGAGYFEASSIVDNGTLIVAAGGQFALYGSLGGNGQIEIGSGAELTVYGTAAASAPTITFEGTGDTLTLSSNAFNASQDFTPTLSGLNANDVIDYQGTVTSAVYASTGTNIGTLTLYDNTTTVGTLTLAGDYTGDTFVTSAIATGTQIVDPPAPPVTIANGANFEISSASTDAVTFAGITGELQLDQSQSFAGTVAGFGNQDQIDLRDIAFSANTTLGYATNGVNGGGTLTASDRVDLAKIAVLGQYAASSFVMASDGHGGTLITEAPELMAQTQLTHPHA